MDIGGTISLSSPIHNYFQGFLFCSRQVYKMPGCFEEIQSEVKHMKVLYVKKLPLKQME